MNSRLAYATIYVFLNAERNRRKAHYAEQLQLVPQTQECDEALTALEWLRQAASVPGPVTDTPDQIALL